MDDIDQSEFELRNIASSSSSHVFPMVLQGRLNLANKDLTGCDAIESIEDLGSVTSLYLSHNRIERFNVKELVRLMPHLENISFDGNQITKLRRCMLEVLPDGSYLDLSNNPINRIGKGVEHAIAGLRDKEITISLYGTNLDISVLELLEKSTQRSALRHTLAGVGLMIAGGLTLGGSTALAILSEPKDSDSRTVQENVMMGGAVCGILLGYCLTALKHVVTIFQHDCHQSRLYWYKQV